MGAGWTGFTGAGEVDSPKLLEGAPHIRNDYGHA